MANLVTSNEPHAIAEALLGDALNEFGLSCGWSEHDAVKKARKVIESRLDEIVGDWNEALDASNAERDEARLERGEALAKIAQLEGGAE